MPARKNIASSLSSPILHHSSTPWLHILHHSITPIRRALPWAAASLLLLLGLSLHSCSPTEPADSYSEYQVYFNNPPASAVVGTNVFFQIMHTQTQDLDSLRFAFQDSASTAPLVYTRVNVYAVSDISTQIAGFTIPGTKRLFAKGYYRQGFTRSDQIYFHVTP